jgi:chemotaxis protein CheD
MGSVGRASLLPVPLPGFEHIHRYWDPHRQTAVAKILPGECYVSVRDEMIATVLGSCVSACVRDRKLGVGGMNHFMLPLRGEGQGAARTSLVTPDLCYGNWAMEYLINIILRNGGRRERLEIKLFGGGKVLPGLSQMAVGRRNVDFALAYLREEKLTVVAQDLYGDYPRKILYFPATGAVKMRRLRSSDAVQQRERAYMETLRAPAQKDVEFF